MGQGALDLGQGSHRPDAGAAGAGDRNFFKTYGQSAILSRDRPGFAYPWRKTGYDTAFRSLG